METEGSRKTSSLRRWVAFWALATTLAAALGTASAWPAVTLSATAGRPSITEDHISYGDARKRQMAAYSKRHYGDREWRLERPKVIVLHFTATDSYSSVWSTFESNAANLGEKPGVCSHYVIEQGGTVDELVAPRIRCRHTVGLNHVAIGIEHVGVSDADVMGRRRQLIASLELTRWLASRHGIRTADVIGHSESLSSPYHRERVAAMRNRTHGDFSSRTMRRYRRLMEDYRFLPPGPGDG